MSFNIILNGKIWGKVEASREGEYTVFYGEGPFVEGIYRLYMLSDEAVQPLGVMMPEDGRLKLRRRVRTAALRDKGRFTKAVLCEGDSFPETETGSGSEPEPESVSLFDGRWLPAKAPKELSQDEILSAGLEKCRGVLYAYAGGSTEVAVPARCHEEISCVLCFAKPERIGSGDYYILKLDGRGRPRTII